MRDTNAEQRTGHILASSVRGAGGFDNYVPDYSNLTAEQTAGDTPKCRCST